MGNQPNVTINTNSGIAQGLSWRDDFFQDYFSENDEDEIVAVFDLDYDRLESHYKCLSWSCLGVSSICMPSIIPWLLIGLVPCHVNKNVGWSVRSQHVALTKFGILRVQEERPACWGGPYCTQNKQTKFIPYSNISQCNVVDAVNSGNCANGLSKVIFVDGSINPHHGGKAMSHNERGLSIVGLEDAHSFSRLVMALKRQQQTPSMTMKDRVETAVATVLESTTNNNNSSAAAAATANGQQEEVVTMLREIRDELRRTNTSSVPMAATVVAEPTAPREE